jgi:hypothetical protein
MLRREFSGSVLRTTISANISNTDTSIAVLDGSTYPTGSNNPFVIVIDRGLSSEEKILITSRLANTLTVNTRGYDGSTAVAHTSGAFIDHVLDASVIQDMNETTYDNQVLMWMGV